MDTITVIEKQEYLLVIFNKLEDYEDIHKIGDLLESEFGMTISKKIDGPDSRVWHINHKEEEFMLINNDPYGNFLKVKSPTGRKLITSLLPQIMIMIDNASK